MTRYTTLPHTADTGIEASGDTLAALLENLAYGMFDLMYDVDELPGGESTQLDVVTGRPTELLVDVLSELIYRSESLDVAYRNIAIAVGETTTTITATPASTSGAALKGPPIKAVTYHDLLVEEQPDGTWRGRVIFDV